MKRTFFTAIVLSSLFFCKTLFALPGFTPFIPDSSGEYVWYKDNSFERESYIGILMYDESTYQIRYFAPKSSFLELPEKQIATLFSVNPQSDFFDMTGERIITSISPDGDDVDILNYLHDFLYEFSRRRIKADDVTPASKEYRICDDFWECGYHSPQDFEQFGGAVTIVFDVTIPLFNIKSIVDMGGKRILECVTTGYIRSSDDKSFDFFEGFSNVQDVQSSQQKKKNTKKAAKIKSKKYTTTDKQTVTLDENWTQSMENFWTLGNESLIAISSLPQYSFDNAQNSQFIIRKLIQSNGGGSYVDFSTLEILYQKNSRIKITSDTRQDGGGTIHNIKLLTENEQNGFYYFSMAVYAENYQENSAYFDKIIKSYKGN